MASSDLAAFDAENTSGDDFLILKELLRRDHLFAQKLISAASTEVAAKLISEHGLTVTPEALWRHRGTLLSSGMPTWRG